MAAAVELKGITKRFPGVVANDRIELSVADGEIHAVVGENGAGKSTLMKILYGMQRPDEGTISVNGEAVDFHTPKDAIDVNIGMVHQHFMLADNLTVLENVVLGSEPRRAANPIIMFGSMAVAAIVALVALFQDDLGDATWPLLAIAAAIVAFGVPRLGWAAGGFALFLLLVRISFNQETGGIGFFDGGLSGGAAPYFLIALGLAALAAGIWLTMRSAAQPMLNFSHAEESIDRLSGSHGVALDPNRLIEDLSVGEKQRVEIVKVLYRGARILILDEPTAVLVPQEVDQLFEDLRALKSEGVTIIFISHKLDEVLAIADSITVVRAGKTVASVKPQDVTAGDLAELMVGSELPVPETAESTVTTDVVLSARGLGAKGEGDRWLVQDLSFDIHRGEILGIAGVEGNGQQELTDLLLGLHAADAGTLEMNGVDILDLDTRGRREAGMGFIPAERHGQGLLLPSPLWENAMLGHQTVPPYEKGIFVDRSGARERTQEIVDQFDVRTPSIDVTAQALSGGNQQKLIVGREMLAEPKLLLASHPTRGIDVGAQAAVWEELRKARALGLAVLIISADLEELLGLSDTLRVILRGRLVAELDPSTVTAPELGSYMTGAREAG